MSLWSLRNLLPAFLLAAGVPGLRAGQVVILGDSLSKEYAVEWLGIGGDFTTPPVPNWAELLDERRHDDFDFGPFGTYSDWRLAGHRHNWAFPGSEARDFRSLLENAPQDLRNQLKNDADRAVIFLGGNDVRVKYGDLYNGEAPGAWVGKLTADITFAVDFVLSERPNLPVVLVSVAHLGGTPKTNGAHPYDAVKTARVTAALDDLNARLRALTRARGIGWADVYAMTRELVTAPRWVLGGYRLTKTADSFAAPDAMFLGDGFHPNFCVQAVFAQRIIDAFNDQYGTRIPRLGNREILENVLGVGADQTMEQWLQAYGVPSSRRGPAADADGDGSANLMEFALDQDPARADTSLLPAPYTVKRGNLLFVRMDWQPRDPAGTRHAGLTVEESADQTEWTPVPAGALSNGPNNTRTVERPAAPGSRLFLRLKAREIP